MTWKELNEQIVGCTKCPRLIEHCRNVAENPPKRHRGEKYWGGPVPGFGDKKARVLIVGLAPAANGANRTGRMFTGDRSGDWLYRALHETGFANQAESTSRGDGLKLKNAFITAAARCAPPGNKPTTEEKENCASYLYAELEMLKRLRVVVALGQIGWSTYLRARRELDLDMPKPQPKFTHAAEHTFEDGITLLGSFHPSQQNTFTKKLTRPMLRRVFKRAAKLAAT